MKEGLCFFTLFILGPAHPLPCLEWEQMTSNHLPDLDYPGSLQDLVQGPQTPTGACGV